MKKRFLIPLLCALLCCLFLNTTTYADDEAPKEKLPNNLGVTEKFGDGFFNARIEGNKLKLTFLDEEKNIIPPPYPEAVARYQYKLDPRGSSTYKPSYNVVLRQSGQSLISERVLRPPHNIFVYITLRNSKESQSPSSRYQNPYSATKKANSLKTKTLPRIHINQLPPLKEEKKKNTETSAAPSRKKYRFKSA